MNVYYILYENLITANFMYFKKNAVIKWHLQDYPSHHAKTTLY